MSSDRARITYNPPQKYRSVVMQQGRVQLEADWNEAQDIISEELRADVLDIVGPYGTPDDGYKISYDPANPIGDFTIGKGTMYVGGEHHVLGKDITYSAQKDLDWVDGPVPAKGNVPGLEHVELYIREQEVSAVEDLDLKEVALGGPDTAQRKRFLQRILRTTVKANDCEKAWDEVLKGWLKLGYAFNPDTMRLLSNDRLQVSFADTGGTPDPCEPAAHGGYLGADNQCIQVKVVSFNANTKKVKIVWGFDNASHLFRAVVQPDQKTLILSQQPVDTFHWPRANQAVELLQSAAKLHNGNFVAENLGFVTTLAADYNVDDQSVVLLSAAAAADFPANQTTPPIFLRLWEQVIEVDLGKAVALGTTGLQVTITQEVATVPISVGDFWIFSVRPTTPQEIYPKRYLDAPQPPEGPRQWLAPLAVASWTDRKFADIIDCREVFDDLVTLTKRKGSGCCTVVVRPEDASKLQDIIDKYKSGDPLARQVTICFMPGVYVLPKPIRMVKEHSNISLEACHGGVVFQAEEKSLVEFLQGMVVLTNTDQTTINGIRFDLPLAPYKDLKDAPNGADLDFLKKTFKDISETLRLAIGIRAVTCSNLVVEHCEFHYTVPKDADVAAIGIYLGGDCNGMRLVLNVFSQTDVPVTATASTKPLRLLAGILLLPTVIQVPVPGATGTQGQVVPTSLSDCVIKANKFEGLSMAGVFYALLGSIRLTNNWAHDCYHGFAISSIYALLYRQGIGQATFNNNMTAGAKTMASGFTNSTDNAVIAATMSLWRSYPVPMEYDLKDSVKVAAKDVAKEPDVDMKVIQPMVDTAMSAFGDVPIAPAAGGTTTLTTGIAPRPVTRATISTLLGTTPQPRARDLMSNFNAVESVIGTIERQAISTLKPTDLVPVIYIAGNEFVTWVPETKTSGSGLTLLSGPQPQGSSVLMEGNYFRNNSQDAAVVITAFERITLTGNQFLNELGGELGRCIDVTVVNQKWLFTATGNALYGFTNMFNITRPDGFPAPLDNWRFANTIRS